MSNIAIIFAGGSGQRMGSGKPKQFIEVKGKPIIIHTLDAFEDNTGIDAIYIACKEEYIDKLEQMISRYAVSKVKRIVPGGKTGQDSIYNALQAAYEAEGGDNIVLIHDGVRPCITQSTINKAIMTATEQGSAITCNTFTETAVISGNGSDIDRVQPRDSIYRVVAPQAFRLGEVIEAYEKVRKENPEYKGIIDTCTLMNSLGKNMSLIEGNRGNIKVTTPEDLYLLRAMLDYKENQQALGLSEEDISENLK